MVVYSVFQHKEEVPLNDTSKSHIQKEERRDGPLHDGEKIWGLLAQGCCDGRCSLRFRSSTWAAQALGNPVRVNGQAKHFRL